MITGWQVVARSAEGSVITVHSDRHTHTHTDDLAEWGRGQADRKSATRHRRPQLHGRELHGRELHDFLLTQESGELLSGGGAFKNLR